MKIGKIAVVLAGRSLLAVAAFALLGAGTVDADLDPNQFGGWVEIGDTNNVDDNTGYGAVDYKYHIAKFEVSKDDWYSSGLGGGTQGDNTPITQGTVSPYDAMQFANALTVNAGGTAYYSDNGDGTYSPDASSHGAYAAANGLTYFVPTEDEWYKAAYGNKNGDGDFSVYSDYANGTDSTPTKTSDGSTGWNYDEVLPGDIGRTWTVDKGTEEQNDTYNMMGNVWEFQENPTVVRGGGYRAPAGELASSYRRGIQPSWSCTDFGFRVVAIPEPVSGWLFALVVGLLWFVRRRARA